MKHREPSWYVIVLLIIVAVIGGSYLCQSCSQTCVTDEGLGCS